MDGEITRQCGVWSWGWNPHGQLGRVEKKNQVRPLYVKNIYFYILNNFIQGK